MSSSTDNSDLAVVFRAHYADLVRASYRVCQDKKLAEDIVQNVFLKIYESGRLSQLTNPAAYLRRAVVTRTLNALRDRKRLSHPGDEVIAVTLDSRREEPDSGEDVRSALHTAIARLPDRARTVLVLHRFEGYSYQDIATQLGISVKTVENHMGRALKMLRSQLPDKLKT